MKLTDIEIDLPPGSLIKIGKFHVCQNELGQLVVFANRRSELPSEEDFNGMTPLVIEKKPLGPTPVIVSKINDQPSPCCEIEQTISQFLTS